MDIYIEKYDRHEGFIILDFIRRQDYSEFCKFIDRSYDENDHRTMLYIEGLHFLDGLVPLEGKLYRMPSELLELSWQKEPGMGVEFESQELEFSDIFSFRAIAKYWGRSFFGTQVSFKPAYLPAINLHWSGPPCGLEYLRDNITTVIKNVGQGNWNEIYSNGECNAIFDLGTSIHFSNLETKRIVNKSQAFSYHPTLVLSHWDIDHYKGIFQIPETKLRNICCAYIPAALVNETSKRAYKKLEDNCNFIVPIKENKVKKVKRKISSNITYQGSNYALFNGEMSTNRNKSGLSLAIWSNNESVLFCGDISYYQVFENMFPFLPQNIKVNLITPHHGGHAGKIDLSKFNKKQAKYAITSTGKNSYGHPFNDIRLELTSNGFQWLRTDYLNTDVVIDL